MEEPDYYKILQIDPGAEQEVIEAAYRRLARKYHPDVNKSPDAIQRMQQINVAYEVLRDPAKRAEYDRARLRRSFYGRRESPRYTHPPRPARKPPILHVHPLHLDFGHLPVGETQTKTLHLTNRGGGTLGGNLEKTAPWLQLSITKVHSNFTIVEVTVDTTDLAPTFYRERIEITSNGGHKSVEVTLRVTAPTEPRPAAVTAEDAAVAQAIPSFWEWWFSPSWTLPVRLLAFALQAGMALLYSLAIIYFLARAFIIQPFAVGLAVFMFFLPLLIPLSLSIKNLRSIPEVFTDEREERHWLERITRAAGMIVGAGVLCIIVLCAVIVATEDVLHTIATTWPTATPTNTPTATRRPTPTRRPTATVTMTPAPTSTPTAVLSPPTATPVPGALGFLEWANFFLDDLATDPRDDIINRYRDGVHISILDGDVGRVCRIAVSPPPETGEDAMDLAVALLTAVGLIEDSPSYSVGLDIVEVMYLREDGGLVFISSDMPTIETYLEERITADEWYDTVDIHSRPYTSPPTPEITYIATPGPLTAQDEALWMSTAPSWLCWQTRSTAPMTGFWTSISIALP